MSGPVLFPPVRFQLGTKQPFLVAASSKLGGGGWVGGGWTLLGWMFDLERWWMATGGYTAEIRAPPPGITAIVTHLQNQARKCHKRLLSRATQHWVAKQTHFSMSTIENRNRRSGHPNTPEYF